MLITIITATYNRSNTLPKLYESLKNQKNIDFEWILVDDGSVDDTEEVVAKWVLENKVKLRYFKTKNGGKTRAVHFGFSQNPKGRFTFVLDSDDYLSDNSLEVMKSNLVDLPDSYIGIIGLKSDSMGRIIGEKFINSVSSYIDVYFGKHSTLGDKLFIIRTKIYRESIVLPFEGEKFMPDNLPYIRSNSLGVYKLINECLYIGEYLEDGMTANVRKMRFSNIQGYIYEKRELQKEKMSFKFKIINNIKFIHFCILNKMSLKEIVSYSEDKLWTVILYLPTVVFLFKEKRLYSELNK